jgi:hypothetical protein
VFFIDWNNLQLSVPDTIPTNPQYASSAFAVSVVNQYIPALGQGATFGLTARYNFKPAN